MPLPMLGLTRRDHLLEQIGIQQYTHRRPQLFVGEVATVLPETTRLLIISDTLISLEQPLLHDILGSMALKSDDLFLITSSQSMMLTEPLSIMVWIIGDLTHQAPLSNHSLLISTTELTQLANSPSAKRALWQQICQYEYYFQLNASN